MYAGNFPFGRVLLLGMVGAMELLIILIVGAFLLKLMFGGHYRPFWTRNCPYPAVPPRPRRPFGLGKLIFWVIVICLVYRWVGHRETRQTAHRASDVHETVRYNLPADYAAGGLRADETEFKIRLSERRVVSNHLRAEDLAAALLVAIDELAPPLPPGDASDVVVPPQPPVSLSDLQEIVVRTGGEHSVRLQDIGWLSLRMPADGRPSFPMAIRVHYAGEGNRHGTKVPLVLVQNALEQVQFQRGTADRAFEAAIQGDDLVVQLQPTLRRHLPVMLPGDAAVSAIEAEKPLAPLAPEPPAAPLAASESADSAPAVPESAAQEGATANAAADESTEEKAKQLAHQAVELAWATVFGNDAARAQNMESTKKAASKLAAEIRAKVEEQNAERKQEIAEARARHAQRPQLPAPPTMPYHDAAIELVVEPQNKRPAWVDDSISQEISHQGGFRTRGSTGAFYATEQDSRGAVPEVMQELTEQYIELLLGKGASQLVAWEQVPRRVAMWTTRETSEATGMSHYNTYVSMEFDRRSMAHIERQWRTARLWPRLQLTAAIAGMVLATLATVLAYLKLDTATRGYYSGRLKLMAGLLMVSILLFGVFVRARQLRRVPIPVTMERASHFVDSSPARVTGD